MDLIGKLNLGRPNLLVQSEPTVYGVLLVRGFFFPVRSYVGIPSHSLTRYLSSLCSLFVVPFALYTRRTKKPATRDATCRAPMLLMHVRGAVVAVLMYM